MIPHLKYPFSISDPVYSPVVVTPGAGYPDAVLPNDPWLYWRMGTDGLNDATANNRDGAANGGATIGGVAGIDADGATSFDGTNDYARLNSGTAFNQAVASLEAWIKLPAAWSARAECVVGCMDSAGSATADKCLNVNSDRKLYAVAFDGGQPVTSAPAAQIPLDTWTHVAMVADGSTLKTYQDGIEVGSVACGNTYAGFGVNNLLVGAAHAAGGQAATYATFHIDEVAAYDYALTPTEVLAHYTAGMAGPSEGTETGGELLTPARAATVDQGSPDEIAQCVFACAATRLGERSENPDFGTPSYLFRQGGVDLDELRRLIEEQEPRASILTEAEFEGMVEQVRISIQ